LKIRTVIKLLTLSTAVGAGVLSTALFVPPVRDKIFSTKLWPWKLPWDTDEEELETIRHLSQPGDILVESNLHGWQWMALSLATTQTSWVHAALVDENKQILTVHKLAIQTDWNIYLDWGSTRLALIRPPYQNTEQSMAAIEYARSKIGTPYDPSFREHSGNCNGLVASALIHAGLPVEQRLVHGRHVFAPDCFFRIQGSEVVWHSDKHR
jgi:uncharacterized protein YycO